MKFKPMLAAEGADGDITYPKIALPKHNGVRGLVSDGVLLARSLKPIVNKYTSSLFSYHELNGLEGELVVGDPFHEEVFTNTTSGVTSVGGEPDVCWYLFDMYHPTKPFSERLAELAQRAERYDTKYVQVIPHFVVNSDLEVQEYAEWALSKGFEGLVLRDPDAKYKEGRATSLENTFLRYVPWFTSEAEILGVTEGEINTNESKPNELGNLKKSTSKAGKIPSGRAGTFQVRDLKTGTEFSMSVPTVALQELVWKDTSKYVGKIARYKFKIGVKKDMPRFAQYEGIRDPIDMS